MVSVEGMSGTPMTRRKTRPCSAAGRLAAMAVVLCVALAVSACGRTVVRAEGSPSHVDWSIGLKF